MVNLFKRKQQPRPGPSLQQALEWYRRFGADEQCLSPTGRVMVGRLVAEIERLTARRERPRADA
jgi:hypothetical protein